MKHFEKSTNLVVIFNQYVTCIFILELKLPTGFVGDNKKRILNMHINFFWIARASNQIYQVFEDGYLKILISSREQPNLPGF